MTNYIKFIIALFVLLVIPWQSCFAVSLLNPDDFSCVKSQSQDGTGDCTLNDFVRIATSLASIILGIVGSLALLAFIVGGVIFLTSGGNAEQVTKGKQIILGAVIGLVIVFASYAIIQFVFTALNIPGTGGGEWATSNNWFNK